MTAFICYTYLWFCGPIKKIFGSVNSYASLLIDVVILVFFRLYKMRKAVCLILFCYFIKLAYCHEGPHDKLELNTLSNALQRFRWYFYIGKMDVLLLGCYTRFSCSLVSETRSGLKCQYSQSSPFTPSPLLLLNERTDH